MRAWLPTVARVLLGLIFTAASIAGLTGQMPPPEGEAAQAFMGLLMSSGLLIVVKVLELIGGLALLSGFFVPLALLVLAPIIVNIAYYHAALDPAGLGISVVLVVLWMANALAYRPLFLPLLQAKSSTTPGV